MAGTLLFKNGDRLTGAWVRVVGTKVVFKSENLGEVTVPLEKLKSLETSKVAVAILKDGRTTRGRLSLSESGAWHLQEKEAVQTVAANNVEGIYPQPIFAPLNPEKYNRPWQNWNGTGTFGYSLVRGDRRANSLSLGLNATRRQPDLPGLRERYRSNVFMTMLFANTEQNNITTSANSLTFGLRQDFLFNPTDFVFVLGQVDHIATQSLNLRQTYGGGLGRDLIRSANTHLSFIGGLTFVNEQFFDGTRRRNAEALLGEKLSWRLTGRVHLDHLFNFYPNVTDVGHYRLDTSTTIATKVNNWLSLTAGVTDRYLSSPPSGSMNNDVSLTTGIGFNF
jgi:putative salt-induced outer membrane protein YdiY